MAVASTTRADAALRVMASAQAVEQDGTRQRLVGVAQQLHSTRASSLCSSLSTPCHPSFPLTRVRFAFDGHP